MARLGDTNKDTESGKLYFGDKDAAYLESISRESLEGNNNMPITYLQIDWPNCHRNFYGELLIKRFVSTTGIQLRGSYQISQNEPTTQNGVPYKTMKLTVSIYTEQLNELNVEPKKGDYFFIGKRYYQIYDSTINDAGPGNLLMNRKRMRADYFAFEVDDETIQKSLIPETPPNMDYRGGDNSVGYQIP